MDKKAAFALSINMSERLVVPHITTDFSVSSLDNEAWFAGIQIFADRYWSGDAAPQSRHFAARMLWSDTALYVRFTANQREELIVSDSPDVSKKTLGLWARDVCEIFVAPDKNDIDKYFEFEVAPTGEWVDLAISRTAEGRQIDRRYASGMQAAAAVQDGIVVMAIKIPWSAFGGKPANGDVWLGNLFRCVGKDPDRGYLCWLPTFTEVPSFHVPERFGEFEFVK